MADDLTDDDRKILVLAFSERYAAAVDRLLRIEGGFVDDPADHGGATKYGISLRFLAAEGKLDLDGDRIADFDLDMDGDIDGQDIRKLTRGDARFLYNRCFWQRIEAETFPPPLGEMMFDQAVNGGLRAARKLLQHAINTIGRKYRYRTIALKVDGVVGPVTRRRLDSMIERHGVSEIADAYREAVKDRYLGIVRADPSQARFIKGWLRRADELGKA